MMDADSSRIIETNNIIQPATMPGIASGTSTLQKTTNQFAPLTAAARSNSSCICVIALETALTPKGKNRVM